MLLLLLKKKERDTDVRHRGTVVLWVLSLDSTSNQATSASYATKTQVSCLSPVGLVTKNRCADEASQH
jgi:hypothetical protein